MPRTVWLASYPKSGNTWFRIFLANLLHPDLAPVHINALPLPTPLAASRSQFDAALGLPSAFLTAEEISRLRPIANDILAEGWRQPLLLRKVHDACIRAASGASMLGEAPGYAAIHLLRHPLDVALSTAHHWSCTPDQAADRLLDEGHTLAETGHALAPQLPQRLLSWESHALSWLAAPMPVLTLRFEDMKTAPLETFRAAVRFLGLPHADDAIAAALEASRLERLQAQEAASGFNEFPAAKLPFFRGGRSGEGHDAISPDRRAALAAAWERVRAALPRPDSRP